MFVMGPWNNKFVFMNALCDSRVMLARQLVFILRFRFLFSFFIVRLNIFSHQVAAETFVSCSSDNKTFRIQKMNNDHVV